MRSDKAWMKTTLDATAALPAALAVRLSLLRRGQMRR